MTMFMPHPGAAGTVWRCGVGGDAMLCWSDPHQHARWFACLIDVSLRRTLWS